MENLINIVTSAGYIQSGYGYKKVTEVNTHWITFYGESLQMYAYLTDDYIECNKIYDTGIIEISEISLNVLIDIFNNNHR